MRLLGSVAPFPWGESDWVGLWRAHRWVIGDKACMVVGRGGSPEAVGSVLSDRERLGGPMAYTVGHRGQGM